MTFAIVAFLIVLILDFLASMIYEPKEQPLPTQEVPQPQKVEPENKKDFETLLLEYESATETVTWEVKNRQ